MTNVLALAPAHRSSSLHSPTPLSCLWDVGFMKQEQWWPHTQHRLRQHLLCVIAPSPTRFTPYILSSSHLPHLHLPLLPPTPFLSFSSHPFLSSCLPSSLSSFFIPFLFHHSSWPEVQLSRYSLLSALLLYSLFPSDDGSPVALLFSSKTGALLRLIPTPPVAACVPSMLLAVSVC